MRVFGADEAGKGPVLGSMFAAAVAAPPDAIPSGVDDSKTLAPDRREELAARLREHPDVEVGVAEVPVERIDDPGTDMNTLTVDAQAEALSRVVRDGESGVVDAGETDADRFATRVADRIAPDVDLAGEHGADGTYPAVAAASIVAKVERDAHVAALGPEQIGTEQVEIGSGYPSDPVTRAFLREYVRERGSLPPCARESWSTCADVLAAAEQSALGEF